IGCENSFSVDVTSPGSINTAVSKRDADCTNGGNSGSVSVTIADPGQYFVALSTDQFIAPEDDEYVPYTHPVVVFNDLPRGQYFVYAKSAAGTCPARSAPI